MMVTAPEEATGSSRKMTEEPITVCHLFSGDLWAGAEAVIFNLLTCLRDDPRFKLIAVSLNEGILTERLRREGIATHVIPEDRHSPAGILWRTARLLSGRNVAVLHSHRYKENALAWLLAKWLGVGAVVTTMHGLPEAPTNSGRHARAVRLRTALDFFILKRFFDATVAVSEDMKRVLIGRHGFHPDRVRLVRNGARFPQECASPTPRGEYFHIGTVGRLVMVKGLDLFLDVAAVLKGTEQRVRFSILGEGPLQEQLRQRAIGLEIADCVDFVAPRPDPFPFYRSLDLYLSTSLHEGLPMSVVEAMACGKPVVSTAVGGIPEIVGHGDHGLLVESRDVAPIAESCLRLIRDERLRLAMGERAAAAARDRWNAEVMAEGYRQLYDTCVGVRGLALARRLKTHGRQLVERLERRRALAIRQRPGRLTRALNEARSILILCQGNVIRSVFAAHLLTAALQGKRKIAIRSAGLATQPGWRAHPRVIARGKALNLDISRHVSIAVTQAMVMDADVVLVMDISQLVAVTRYFPRARRRTFLLTALASDVPMDIHDPAGQDDAAVDACLDHVARAMKPLGEILAASRP